MDIENAEKRDVWKSIMVKKPKIVHEDVEDHETHIKIMAERRKRVGLSALEKHAEKDIKQHKKIMKKKYWQKRAIEKITQAIKNSNDLVIEARDIMIHADLYPNEIMNAFIGIGKAYNKLAEEIEKSI